MYAAYERLESAEQVARMGVEAGCEFDSGSSLPMTVYSVQIDKTG